MYRSWIFLGAVYAAIGVGLGAFAAHALKDMLSEYHQEVFNTANRYQFIHSFGLIIIGIIQYQLGYNLNISGWSFFWGIALFCGSLYVIALADIRWIGAITPIGGILFIVGWIWLAFQVYRGN